MGIRHPEMEGEKTAFNSKARHHQADGHGHGQAVGLLLPESGNGLMQLGKQQVARDGIG